MKSDYGYSNNVVYNNFIWCNPTDKQRRAIEQSAQKILDVRAKYPAATLAELYDEISMPYNLRQAHKKMTVLLPPFMALKIFWTMNLLSS